LAQNIINQEKKRLSENNNIDLKLDGNSLGQNSSKTYFPFENVTPKNKMEIYSKVWGNI
jgi:hypothetical protein